MLSKIDIFKGLGKDLCIYPFTYENIKENSINVTISEYAWTQTGGTVYWYGGKTFTLTEIPHRNIVKTLRFRAGQKASFLDKKTNKRYLLLFPHQTTNVESLEVIGIGEKLGGAVHSKVGIVSKGIGDCGTMLGPGYCGHLLFSLHNITNDLIVMEEGETCGSLTFDYLKTGVIRESATCSSHYDRLSEMKFQLDQSDWDYFHEDWKVTIKGIKEKMISSEEYDKYKKKHPDNLLKQIMGWFCMRNILLSLGFLLVLGLLYLWAYSADKNLTEKIWVSRYFAGIIYFVSGVLITNFFSLYKR